MRAYSKYSELPDAVTNGPLIPGCLILEGGGWRGLYTQGALDAMMEEDINIQTGRHQRRSLSGSRTV